MVGAGLGGIGGFYNGLKSTTKLGQTGSLRRTQMLNYIMKQGAARANTLGTIAVLYSGFGVILSWLRGVNFTFLFWFFLQNIWIIYFCTYHLIFKEIYILVYNIVCILLGNDDELNTLAAGTATGLLYKSTSGLKKCGMGAAVGFALSGLYCLATAKDKLEAMIRR